MLINGKEKFLLRASVRGDQNATRELYKIYSDSNERFIDAANLYMHILKKFPPNEAIEMIYLDGDFNSLSQKQIEKEILVAIVMVAKYELLHGNLYRGVNWVKKGMDLFELFHSNYPEKMKVTLKEKSDVYQNLSKKFDTYKDYFYPDCYYGRGRYEGLKMEWESNYIPSIHYNNDNVK